jgi:molybdate transport system substrate-binding protein
MGSLALNFTSFLSAALLGLTLPGPAIHAATTGRESVSVAAAANLVYAVDALNAAFRTAEPDTDVTVASGASGNLVAQITHGAPYDVFLSADLDYPQALIAAGHADGASLTVFASGRLVLWAVDPAVPLESIAAIASHPRVRSVAVANIDSAPYGRAAKQALEKLGLWRALSPRLVYGESVSQTAQFVESGSADVGFVALSLVLSPRLQSRGRWLAVPEELYTPLTQGAVLTRRGKANPAAARYVAFLRSDAAREVFVRFGYTLPARP